jgi:hypothetical protein
MTWNTAENRAKTAKAEAENFKQSAKIKQYLLRRIRQFVSRKIFKLKRYFKLAQGAPRREETHI